MKIYAYRFCKTNNRNRNKAQPIFLMGRDLWMRCAHKNETRKICFCLDCTDFAVFLCICLFKVPAPGPWNPAFTYAFWLPWLCWGSCLPSQKPIFFAPIGSQHLASAWASPFPETGLHLFCPFQPPTAEFVLPEDRLPQVAVPWLGQGSRSWENTGNAFLPLITSASSAI